MLVISKRGDSKQHIPDNNKKLNATFFVAKYLERYPLITQEILPIAIIKKENKEGLHKLKTFYSFNRKIKNINSIINGLGEGKTILIGKNSEQFKEKVDKIIKAIKHLAKLNNAAIVEDNLFED